MSYGKAAGACLAAAFVLLAGAAHSQQPPAQTGPQAPVQAQGQAQQQPKTAPAVEPNRPGFIDAFGHWIGDSVSNWNSGIKGAADAAKDAAGVAKDAAGAASDAAKGAGSVVTDTAGAVARIPATRVIAQRTLCPVAPNGAPDCRLAAETVCKAHGFASGSSVDFQTVEKCPPVALNRPDNEPQICVIESYVTRALCR
jgi:hypothetical protein